MTFTVMTILALLTGYLLGSISFAIPLTRLFAGKDIRTLGNHNPGASNVMRTVSKPLGLLIVLLDVLKGVVPIMLFRYLFFYGPGNADAAVLYGIGIAAVLGHCKSIFLNFHGGGGISTMLGVSLYFIPLEFLAAMLIGGILVILFFKDAQYRFGQKTPIFFVTLTPFFALLTSLTMDVTLLAHWRLGGHLPATIAGAFVMSLMLLAINVIFLNKKVRETNLESKT